MSNNSSSYESDLENSIVLNVNLDALKKSALNMEDGKEYIGRSAISIYPQWKTEIRAEYILMEYLPGIYLCDIKSNLNIKKKKLFLLKIIDIQLVLKKFTFSKIGSIFFNSKNDQFKIGQVVESIFFTGKRATLPTMERSPFKTTKKYILAVIQN
ncbi:phosphotransferase enzyme family protein [Gigaspora margarita]|uniref:Phosphotransferase enzyme family protein n=1 Tax=Gigaspora margarita TaxID=4874 RepID=A0A8H3WX49_GIGMA|nr:phosphotransferase enzyme family protein [Gigaspora margarita]